MTRLCAAMWMFSRLPQRRENRHPESLLERNRIAPPDYFLKSYESLLWTNPESFFRIDPQTRFPLHPQCFACFGLGVHTVMVSGFSFFP